MRTIRDYAYMGNLVSLNVPRAAGSPVVGHTGVFRAGKRGPLRSLPFNGPVQFRLLIENVIHEGPPVNRPPPRIDPELASGFRFWGLRELRKTAIRKGLIG